MRKNSHKFKDKPNHFYLLTYSNLASYHLTSLYNKPSGYDTQLTKALLLMDHPFNTKFSEKLTLLEGTVMQIEKVLINDRLLVSKLPWKFLIPTIHIFTVIYSWNLLFSFIYLLYNLHDCTFNPWYTNVIVRIRAWETLAFLE